MHSIARLKLSFSLFFLLFLDIFLLPFVVNKNVHVHNLREIMLNNLTIGMQNFIRKFLWKTTKSLIFFVCWWCDYVGTICLALQSLVNVCMTELQFLDMAVNTKKSACMRFGSRYTSSCGNVVIAESPINWVTSARYLGVYLESSVRFKCSMFICQ